LTRFTRYLLTFRRYMGLCVKRNYLPQVKPSGFCMYLSVFWYWRSWACMLILVMMIVAMPPVMPSPQ